MPYRRWQHCWPKEDEELREAILVALGRIATVPAADALRGFANQAPATLKDVVVDARLQAAESLCRQMENIRRPLDCASRY